jgi:hypothetical protein
MNLSKPLSLRLSLSLLLGLSALAGDNYVRVPLPPKDVAKTFLVASDPVNRDGTFNAVAQAPAKEKKGVKAVPLGLVPRSILAKSKGGNDAPVQAYILGVQPAPGEVVKSRAVGLVIRTVAGKDETRVALVAWDSNLGSCRSLDDVEKLAPGTLASLKEGFGPAKDPAFATKGRKEALRFLGDAITDFICAYVTDADKRPLDKDGNPMVYPWAGARNIGE